MAEAPDMDPAGLQLNREQDVERNQTPGSPDFGGEEIGGGKGVPVTLKKLRPCRPSPAKRCRFDTVLFQDPLHRVRRDLVAQVGHSSLDSSVAPRRARLGHAHDQLLDFRRDGRTPRLTTRVRPFPRDELTMPSEDRIRGDQSCHFREEFPSKLFPLGREPSTLLVAQA